MAQENRIITAADTVRNFSTLQSIANKWNGYKVKELERIVDPDKQLDILQQKRTNLTPAEILYSHGIWETKQKIYEHYSEETVRCVGDNSVMLPFISKESKNKLLAQNYLMIHVGIVLIRITGLTRAATGGQVLLNIID